MTAPIEYAVVGEWLCEVGGGCDCGVGPHGYFGMHERNCELEPIAKVADLLAAFDAQQAANNTVMTDLAED